MRQALVCVGVILLAGRASDGRDTLPSLARPANVTDKKKDQEFPPVERGLEHKVLESLVGTWDASIKFYVSPEKPLESKGVMTRTMILGGNFLQESFTGEFVGKKFAGQGVIGYDYNKEKFVTTWCDSRSTSIVITHGDFDSRKKTLTSIGEDFDHNTKRKMKVRDVLRVISADEQILEMYRHPAGEREEYKIMQVRYTRRKEK
jgi:hypothetical protein